jgi:hypothetical protein
MLDDSKEFSVNGSSNDVWGCSIPPSIGPIYQTPFWTSGMH